MTTFSTLLAQASDTSSGSDAFLGLLIIGVGGWLLYHLFKPRGWTLTSHSRHELRPR